MELPSVFDACTPKDDILAGKIVESDFAADLAKVIKGEAPADYQDPIRFFANTHPTRGIKNLLENICHRLRGDKQNIASIFRLDTNYGGGKTHALIALYHASQGMGGVANVAEFLNPELLPAEGVKVAAFDGDIADPANGRIMDESIKAHTPWGEIAYQLKGKEGYALVQKSDEQGIAPGAETLQALFSGSPTLILIDELAVYLRKHDQKTIQDVANQLTAFLSSLFRAVASSARTALVFTLAIGKDKKGIDAYSDENELIVKAMSEAASIVARTSTLLDPTEEDETVKILRRRLFSTIDEQKAERIIQRYAQLWHEAKEHLPDVINAQSYIDNFRNGFPLHPELMETLTEKTATLANFQRVRGMLRLLARAVSELWQKKPSGTYAVHLWHIDPGISAIRQEFLTKLEQGNFTAALKADVAASEEDANNPSLAEELDASKYKGLPPYTQAVARTIFIHSLAFNDNLKGISTQYLCLSILSPSMDISYINLAKRDFIKESSYLAESPDRPIHFQTEANLNQIIRQAEKKILPDDVRTHINAAIQDLFTGADFELVPLFPSEPNDLSDVAAKPLLVVLSYEGVSISSKDADNTVPPLVLKLFNQKGANGEPRIQQNNLVFLVIDSDRVESIKNSMRRKLALIDLSHSSQMHEFASYQQDKIKELLGKVKKNVAIDIQQAYRHLYYPSTQRTTAECRLAHTSLNLETCAAKPGDGQSQVTAILHSLQKLCTPKDMPSSPEYIRESTPLKTGKISMAELRKEYRCNPALPILLGNTVFQAGIKKGINQGYFVYQDGEFLYGKGDPEPSILKIEENVILMTKAYAEEHKIWPRPEPKPALPPEQPTPSETSGTNETKQPEQGTDGISTSPSQPKEFQSDGLLKEALTLLWEHVRSAKVDTLSLVSIEDILIKEAVPIIKLANGLPNAEKKLEIDGNIVTPNDGNIALTFDGSMNDSAALLNYLTMQLNSIKQVDMTAIITLTYPKGLDMNSNTPEMIIDRLSRAGSAATATVRAKAKV